MHLLYLDDSGSVGNASDRHIILAGLAVFERQTHWLSRSLEGIAESLWPENPANLEFRGADIFSGKKHWRGLQKEPRMEAYRTSLEVIGKSPHARLFGAAIDKASVSPDEPMEFAFEQLCNRFDRMLQRLHYQGDTQRGIIILDKSTYETSLQQLTREFRNGGHRWGVLRNLSEVPLFVDSQATRMIQYADLIAYAMRRYFEKGEAQLFNIIAPRFDHSGGVLHGLVHKVLPGSDCVCPACLQRQRPVTTHAGP